MGVNPDFSLTYEEHFPEQPDAPTEPGDTDPVEPDTDNGWITTVIIISASVVGAAVIALAVIIFLKKRFAK